MPERYLHLNMPRPTTTTDETYNINLILCPDVMLNPHNLLDVWKSCRQAKLPPATTRMRYPLAIDNDHLGPCCKCQINILSSNSIANLPRRRITFQIQPTSPYWIHETRPMLAPVHVVDCNGTSGVGLCSLSHVWGWRFLLICLVIVMNRVRPTCK